MPSARAADGSKRLAAGAADTPDVVLLDSDDEADDADMAVPLEAGTMTAVETEPAPASDASAEAGLDVVISDSDEDQESPAAGPRAEPARRGRSNRKATKSGVFAPAKVEGAVNASAKRKSTSKRRLRRAVDAPRAKGSRPARRSRAVAPKLEHDAPFEPGPGGDSDSDDDLFDDGSLVSDEEEEPMEPEPLPGRKPPRRRRAASRRRSPPAEESRASLVALKLEETSSDDSGGMPAAPPRRLARRKGATVALDVKPRLEDDSDDAEWLGAEDDDADDDGGGTALWEAAGRTAAQQAEAEAQAAEARRTAFLARHTSRWAPSPTGRSWCISSLHGQELRVLATVFSRLMPHQRVGVSFLFSAFCEGQHEKRLWARKALGQDVQRKEEPMRRLEGTDDDDEEGGEGETLCGGGCILADAMGLGKTVQVCTALGGIHRGRARLNAGKHSRHKLAPCFLLVVPKNTLYQWADHLRDWAPGVKPFVFDTQATPKPDLEHMATQVKLRGGALICTLGTAARLARIPVLRGTRSTVTPVEAFAAAPRGHPREVELGMEAIRYMEAAGKRFVPPDKQDGLGTSMERAFIAHYRATVVCEEDTARLPPVPDAQGGKAAAQAARVVMPPKPEPGAAADGAQPAEPLSGVEVAFQTLRAAHDAAKAAGMLTPKRRKREKKDPPRPADVLGLGTGAARLYASMAQGRKAWQDCLRFRSAVEPEAEGPLAAYSGTDSAGAASDDGASSLDGDDSAVPDAAKPRLRRHMVERRAKMVEASRYEAPLRAVGRGEAARRRSWDVMVVDEAHMSLRSSNNKTVHRLRQVGRWSSWLLTGTPMVKEVQELPVLLGAACSTQRVDDIFGSRKDFEKLYQRPILASREPSALPHERIKGVEAATRLQEELRPMFLRRIVLAPRPTDGELAELKAHPDEFEHEDDGAKLLRAAGGGDGHEEGAAEAALIKRAAAKASAKADAAAAAAKQRAEAAKAGGAQAAAGSEAALLAAEAEAKRAAEEAEAARSATRMPELEVFKRDLCVFSRLSRVQKRLYRLLVARVQVQKAAEAETNAELKRLQDSSTSQGAAMHLQDQLDARLARDGIGGRHMAAEGFWLIGVTSKLCASPALLLGESRATRYILSAHYSRLEEKEAEIAEKEASKRSGEGGARAASSSSSSSSASSSWDRDDEAAPDVPSEEDEADEADAEDGGAHASDWRSWVADSLVAGARTRSMKLEKLGDELPLVGRDVMADKAMILLAEARALCGQGLPAASRLGKSIRGLAGQVAGRPSVGSSWGPVVAALRDPATAAPPPPAAAPSSSSSSSAAKYDTGSTSRAAWSQVRAGDSTAVVGRHDDVARTVASLVVAGRRPAFGQYLQLCSLATRTIIALRCKGGIPAFRPTVRLLDTLLEWVLGRPSEGLRRLPPFVRSFEGRKFSPPRSLKPLHAAAVSAYASFGVEAPKAVLAVEDDAEAEQEPAAPMGLQDEDPWEGVGGPGGVGGGEDDDSDREGAPHWSQANKGVSGRAMTRESAPDVEDDPEVMARLRRSEAESDPVRHVEVEDLVRSSGKVRLVLAVLGHLRAMGHRVAVFSEWKRVLDILARVVSSRGMAFARIDGDTSAVDRATICESFNRGVGRREERRRAFAEVLEAVPERGLEAPAELTERLDRVFGASVRRLAAAGEGPEGAGASAKGSALRRIALAVGPQAMAEADAALASAGGGAPGDGEDSDDEDVVRGRRAPRALPDSATLSVEHVAQVSAADDLLGAIRLARSDMLQGLKDARPSMLAAIATGMTLKHGAQPCFWGDARRAARPAASARHPRAAATRLTGLRSSQRRKLRDAVAMAKVQAAQRSAEADAFSPRVRSSSAMSSSSSSTPHGGGWTPEDADGELGRAPRQVIAAQALADAMEACGLQDRPGLVEPRDADDADVILITKGAGGVGMNLQGASVAVLVDPWWTGARDEQAICRVYRQHQTSDVLALRLFGAGTVEASKAARQMYRTGVATMVQEDDPRSRVFSGQGDGGADHTEPRGLGTARLFGADELKATLPFESVKRGEGWCRAALEMAAALVPRPCTTRDQAETLAALVSVRSPLGPGRGHLGVVDHSGVVRQFRTQEGVAERVRQAKKAAAAREEEARRQAEQAAKARAAEAERQAAGRAAMERGDLDDVPPAPAGFSLPLPGGGVGAAPGAQATAYGTMLHAIAQGLLPAGILDQFMASGGSD